MSDERNGWNEWSRHVLKELERLNSSYQQISEDVAELKAKVLNYNPEKITIFDMQLQGLERSDLDQERRLRLVEQGAAVTSVDVGKIQEIERSIGDLKERDAKMSGKWAILAVIGAAIVSAAVGFVFKIFASNATATSYKPTDSTIELRLDSNQIEDLRKPA